MCLRLWRSPTNSAVPLLSSICEKCAAIVIKKHSVTHTWNHVLFTEKTNFTGTCKVGHLSLLRDAKNCPRLPSSSDAHRVWQSAGVEEKCWIPSDCGTSASALNFLHLAEFLFSKPDLDETPPAHSIYVSLRLPQPTSLSRALVSTEIFYQSHTVPSSVSSVFGSLLPFFHSLCLQSPLSSPLSRSLMTLSKRFTLMGGKWSYVSKPNSKCCCGRRKSSKWFLNTWKIHKKEVRGAAEVVTLTSVFVQLPINVNKCLKKPKQMRGED